MDKDNSELVELAILKTNVKNLNTNMDKIEVNLAQKIDQAIKAIDSLNNKIEENFVSKVEFSEWKVKSSIMWGGIGFAASIIGSMLISLMVKNLIGL